jgi:hypothetical protein
MSKPMSSKQKDLRQLAIRLREEAEADRPEFSPALHKRLCKAMKKGQAVGRRQWAQWSPPRRFGRGILTAAAALCMGGLLFIPWDMSGGKKDQPVAIQPDDASTAPSAVAVNPPASTKDWDYLVEDAQTLLQTLPDHLPIDLTGALVVSESER